jgi:histidyl-tRNA synthetase
LVETLGGAAVAGTGFAIGIDRLALALDATKFKWQPDATLIALGDSAMRAAMRLSGEMRAAGLNIELLSPGRGLKALLRRASKLGAHYALIIGDNEIAHGTAQLRDLRLSTQREIAWSDAAKVISAKCRRCDDHEPAS